MLSILFIIIFVFVRTFSQCLNDTGTHEFKLRLLNNGKCLDGSPGGYYYSPGQGNNSDKHLIMLEGGGWCYDQNYRWVTDQGTLTNCAERSHERLGSSKSWPVYDNFDGLLSGDAAKNPLFYDWSRIKIKYCDGTSFSGKLSSSVNANGTSIWFQGKIILENVFKDLLGAEWFEGAQKTILSGESAGATAVFYHLNFVSNLLGYEVIGMPDAGLFLDINTVDGVRGWPKQLDSVMRLSNGTNNVDIRCLEKFPEETWKCHYPEYFLDLYTEPMFIFQSLYDKSEIEWSLMMNCKMTENDCDQQEIAAFQNLRTRHIQVLEMLNTEKQGYWWISCVAHTMGWWALLNEKWAIPANSGYDLERAISDYIQGKEVLVIDEDPFPKNKPCSSYW